MVNVQSILTTVDTLLTQTKKEYLNLEFSYKKTIEQELKEIKEELTSAHVTIQTLESNQVKLSTQMSRISTAMNIFA